MITRVNRNTVIDISANFAPSSSLSNVQNAFLARVKALEPGSSVRSSLGTVVIGGILSSLFLTLVLVLVMYMWLAPAQLPVNEPAPHAPLKPAGAVS